MRSGGVAMMRLQLPDFVVEIDGLVEIDEQGRRWLPDVDDEIAPAVLALWAAGIPTRYSCSGHGGDTGVVMTAVPGGDTEQWLCVMTAAQMADLHSGCGGRLDEGAE